MRLPDVAAAALPPPSFIERALGLVALARPGNVLMAGVGVAVGALVAGPTGQLVEVVLAAVATMLVVAGGNALNDVADREVDRLAHPGRPLPSGRIGVTGALALAAASFAGALGLAALVSIGVLLLVAAAEALLAAYEMHLKEVGLIGNVTVALLVGATFVAGALAVGVVALPVLFLAGLAFLANVAREVWKDAEDAPHDAGRRTVAQRWGIGRARRLAQLALVAAIALSPVPFLLDFGSWWHIVLVAAADGLFIMALAAPQPGTSQRLSKVGMLVALAAFAVGGAL